MNNFSKEKAPGLASSTDGSYYANPGANAWGVVTVVIIGGAQWWLIPCRLMLWWGVVKRQGREESYDPSDPRTNRRNKG